MSQLNIFLAFLLLQLLLPFIACSTGLTNKCNFTSFSDDEPRIKRLGGAVVDNSGTLELTSSDRGENRNHSGWAIYAENMRLYDPSTGFAADFQSNFSFEIIPSNGTCRGDGLTFFMAPANWTAPKLTPNADFLGGGLGILNRTLDSVTRQIIAVEFDTHKNSFDPSANHMGIDVNSVNSRVTANWMSDESGSLNGTAVVGYNSRTGKLSSYLSYRYGILDIYLDINLTTVLPETVVFGFSAATGTCVEAHRITAWNFSATSPPDPKMVTQNKMVIILVACLIPLIIIVLVIILFIMRIRKQKKVKLKEQEEEENIDGLADVLMNFETGPRRFRYRELAAATNDFNEEGKLGQGGFGGVYHGTLRDTSEVVAVKRFSKGSSQGKKEYVAEVTAISRLRHRNLVRLIGWCHERGEFLLVYEYMEGGSLDSHLFESKTSSVLSWAQRRKVVLGLASAVSYLHEEWEQCVVHRDIKLSNVMVDSEFNARLGDFGLARMTNHGFTPRTTRLAGTVGYLAPECVITGKASTQSDVYSFGVVLLEIGSGRRTTRPIGEKEVGLIEWIWELYGTGSLMEAVDERLGSEFDQQEMERMMVVGLWCVHPDPDRRPTMKGAIRVLSFQAEIPSLPEKMPVPVYMPPSMNDFNSSLATSTESLLRSGR